MISKEREAEILRLYHAESWRVNTIARQLGVHHTTVQRVLVQAGIPSEKLTARRRRTLHRAARVVRVRSRPGAPTL